jgi:hypothetical protein
MEFLCKLVVQVQEPATLRKLWRMWSLELRASIVV